MNHHLQLHENIHSGIKPYTCKTCSKSFASTSSLRAHETVHRDERAYLCGICGRAFKRPHQLKRHEKGHSGDRPFKCTYCEKTFTRASHQRNHEKVIQAEISLSVDIVIKVSVAERARKGMKKSTLERNHSNVNSVKKCLFKSHSAGVTRRPTETQICMSVQYAPRNLIEVEALINT